MTRDELSKACQKAGRFLHDFSEIGGRCSPVRKSVKHRIGNAPNTLDTRASNFLIPLTEML